MSVDINLRSRINTDLTELRVLISALPNSIPEGQPDGPIARHFGEIEFDHDEGPYFSLDRAWTRTFQGLLEADMQKLITRGPFGVECILNCLVELVGRPDIEQNGGLFLLGEQLKTLKGTVTQVVISACAAAQGHSAEEFLQLLQETASSKETRTLAAVSGTHIEPEKVPEAIRSSKKRKNEATEIQEGRSAFERMADKVLGVDKSSAPAKKKPRAKPDMKCQQKLDEQNKSKKKSSKQPIAVDEEFNPKNDQGHTDTKISDDNAPQVSHRGGRKAWVAEWAFEHFNPTIATSKDGKPIWKWMCKHCDVYHSSPRTKGCKKYSEEKLPRPLSTNFSAHLKDCKGLPAEQAYDMWKQRKLTAIANGGNVSASSSLMSNSGPSGQRTMMHNFVERAAINPEKKVTKRGFWEYFVKGIIEDDLAFSFGEKNGMRCCFTYILPQGYQVPNSTMVQRDLNLLYKAMDQKLTAIIKNVPSRISIASDLWTSKNSVYAFAGICVFWIGSEWQLVMMPLELLALDGDHSGATTARLIFKALKQQNIALKLLGSAGDNASSNGPLNSHLAKRICKSGSSITLSADDMQIGCGGHVTHLVVQAIYCELGLAPDPQLIDLWEEARNFPMVYDSSTDPDILEQTEKAIDEAKVEHSGQAKDTDHESDDASDEDAGSDNEIEEGDIEKDSGDEGNLTGQQTTEKSTQNIRHKKVFSSADKVYAIVVDILRSEVRRKRMRRITRQLCHGEAKNLVLIRGMPIRWNTTYAEIERALLLRTAIDHWVRQLDAGLTGKKREAARRKKKKWELTLNDWDELDELCKLLSPFTLVTLQFSKESTPTICMILPLYKHMETHLKDSALKVDSENLRRAIAAGLNKLSVHLDRALVSKYPLLGAVLHPCIRLKFFENQQLWSPDIPRRARKELEALYAKYSKSSASQTHKGMEPSKTATASTTSIFRSAIFGSFEDGSEGDGSSTPANLSEIDLYFSMAYPCHDEDRVLMWWKDNESHFPVLATIARDILAISSVSISVERLFSQAKHTLPDAHSSMTAESASRTVISKEWLKCGLGDDIQYLDGVSIWHTD